MKNVFLINQEEFFLSCKTKDDTGKLLDLVKQFFKPIILFFKIFFIYSFGSAGSQLQHMGSSVFVEACRIQFPVQGSNPGSLYWEPSVLVTGQPGKSQHYFKNDCFQRPSVSRVVEMSYLGKKMQLCFYNKIDYSHQEHQTRF